MTPFEKIAVENLELTLKTKQQIREKTKEQIDIYTNYMKQNKQHFRRMFWQEFLNMVLS